jgi:hypothetical protein
MVYCCFHLILASLNPPFFVYYTHVRIYYQNSFGWRKPPFVVMLKALFVMFKKVLSHTQIYLFKMNKMKGRWPAETNEVSKY